MKIGLTTHTFTPEFIGGRETHVEALAKTLSKDDDVIVFAGSNVKKVVKEYRDNYILYRIPSYPITISKNPLQTYRISPKFYSVLCREKLDLIHSHEYGHFTTDISALYCKIFKIPFILTIHGYVIKNSVLNTFKNIYDNIIGSMVLKTANKIIIVSEKQREDTIKWNGNIDRNKLVYIPNGIFMDEFKNLNYDEGVYRRYNFGNGPLILSVGRILPRKGFIYLIDAAKKIKQRYPNARFAIAGPDSGDTQNLIKRINENDLSNNVFILGAVKREELMYLYSRADVFAIPSLYEGLPTTLLEAMAFGIPTVGSNIDGIRAVIDNVIDGLLVPPANADILADNICLLLEDKNLVNKISKNSKEKVKNYDWNIVASQIRKIYERYD